MNNTRNGGGDIHKTVEKNVERRYQEQGWKVVNLQGKSPDLIAVKDNKLICIEILGFSPKRSNKKNIFYKQKKFHYGVLGFDDVVIESFQYDKW